MSAGVSDAQPPRHTSRPLLLASGEQRNSSVEPVATDAQPVGEDPSAPPRCRLWSSRASPGRWRHEQPGDPESAD